MGDFLSGDGKTIGLRQSYTKKTSLYSYFSAEAEVFVLSAKRSVINRKNAKTGVVQGKAEGHHR
ncbi:hypothetical protein [Pantoea vagans]|uniref:hypothetical protein n=1 Tax=Pantoea vagans TaxID=470934 RepID=UPI000510762B|nr:hypothetical protein [Pantoea vagans]KGD77938.1 hypothetical protein ID11_06560 [Pantoea vagans]